MGARIPITRKIFKSGKGNLYIIGGHEDRTGEMRILKDIVTSTRRGKVVVVTVGSHSSEKEVWNIYRKAFTSLGVRCVEHLDLTSRSDKATVRRLKTLEGARVVFFTGGDQLRITSQLGGTKFSDRIHELYESGTTICGTSAGAAVMGETMLVSGGAKESHRIGTTLLMGPGMGYLRGIIVDQHFAERGRIGRLLGALAENPEYLGVGIDEDTCVVVESEVRFRVLGSGAVYVLDGRGISQTNISDGTSEQTMSLHDVRLHVLCEGDFFDLKSRQPTQGERPKKKSKRSD